MERAGINMGVVGGILMMVGSVVWFAVAYSQGYFFPYTLVLFVLGIVAVIKGIIDGNMAGNRRRRRRRY
jgi:hypothetical protein